MARSIADIEKAIADKKKMADKNAKDAPKVQTEIEELASQKVQLDSKIEKEKDVKKKTALSKERDEVMGKHKNAKLKQQTMEKAETGIQEAIEKLEEELETVKDGVEKYGKARKAGLAMLEREGKKLEAAAAKAKENAEAAEACSREAEAATKRADVNAAQGAKNNANNAVMAAVNAQREAANLIDGIKNEMTSTQRNLKAKDFDVVDADVKVHNNLTKQVQDRFKELESLAGECSGWVERAEKAAEEAREFADATEVGQALYEKILDTTTKEVQDRIKEIQGTMAAKWGGYITARGELFTRLLKAMEAKPGDLPTRVVAEKAVEQGQTYLEATKSNVDAKVKEVVDNCNRATKRVPDEYQRALKAKVDRLRMLVMQLLTIQKKINENYTATKTEFDKLQQAVDG